MLFKLHALLSIGWIIKSDIFKDENRLIKSFARLIEILPWGYKLLTTWDGVIDGIN